MIFKDYLIVREKYIATDRDDLDITDIEKVREFVKDKNITLIINCAAYNNVDKAEDEVEICKKLNTYAPRDLAIVAKEIGADFVTYSTDFVFDGEKKPHIQKKIFLILYQFMEKANTREKRKFLK